MSDKVFLIHGWSVQETTTYQALHQKLAANGYQLVDINLGRYVSLENNVEIRDIAKALHNALKKEFGANGKNWTNNFHIITHSTGALVVKKWIVDHYRDAFVSNKPLENLVFLAGPHFGSRLAHHGKSMLAQARYMGPTGKQILTALELGSRFSWDINEAWLDKANWKRKGIRPFNIIGDRVKNDFFKSKIFPAGYEDGSDMVVRVPAGNLNFRRFELMSATKKAKLVGNVEGIPFCALGDYTHSGEDEGIMNSITTKAIRGNHLPLKLILDCLAVGNNSDYEKIATIFANLTTKTRKKREGYAQLDFRFRDETGAPVNDYAFKLGCFMNGKRRASKCIVHTHKNEVHRNHFTVFIRFKEIEPKLIYFIEMNSESNSALFRYDPDPLHVEMPAGRITDLIQEEQTTQIDVVLSRNPEPSLFVFHQGDDPNLHVAWDRKGIVTQTGMPIK